VPRYLAEFEYRFNRGCELEDMITRLAFLALRTPPMKDKLLQLAEYMHNQESFLIRAYNLKDRQISL
jgi:hypothetical protein